MTKVDFMLVGAARSGTTSLASHLAAHPEICFCKKKEPRYFNKARPDPIENYHKLFNPQKGQLCGEASVCYSQRHRWPKVAKRIASYNPEMKIIYLMRHPLERLRSHFSVDIANERADKTFFNDFVSTYQKAMKSKERLKRFEKEFVVRDAVDTSRYAYQLEPYLKVFPQKNILPIFLEDYLRQTDQVLNRIANFLGIDAKRFKPNGFHQNSAAELGTLFEPFKSITQYPATRMTYLWIPKSIRKKMIPWFLKSTMEGFSLPIDLQKQLWELFLPELQALETQWGLRTDVWQPPQTA